MVKEFSRRDFLKTSAKLAGLAALAVTGCATRRPDLNMLVGDDFYKMNSEPALGEIENGKYHVHGVTIFKEPYYYTNTPIGEILLKESDTTKWDYFELNEKGLPKKVFSYVLPIEEGLYFIEQEINRKTGKPKESVKLDPQHMKAIIKDHLIIQQNGDWGVFCEIGDERQYKLPFGKPSINPYVAIEVEESEKRKGAYPFYLVDVNKINVGTTPKGEIMIFNPGRIKRPIFHQWEEIKTRVSRLNPKQKQITEETLNDLGLKAINSK